MQIFGLVVVVLLVAVALFYFVTRRAPKPDSRHSELDAGAKDVSFPAPGQITEDAEPGDATVEHRMAELETLKNKGQITRAEYETRKKNLMQ